MQAVATDGLRLIRNILSMSASALPAGNDQAVLLGRADPPDPERLVRNVQVFDNFTHRWPGTGIVLAGGDGVDVATNAI